MVFLLVSCNKSDCVFGSFKNVIGMMLQLHEISSLKAMRPLKGYNIIIHKNHYSYSHESEIEHVMLLFFFPQDWTMPINRPAMFPVLSASSVASRTVSDRITLLVG